MPPESDDYQQKLVRKAKPPPTPPPNAGIRLSVSSDHGANAAPRQGPRASPKVEEKKRR